MFLILHLSACYRVFFLRETRWTFTEYLKINLEVINFIADNFSITIKRYLTLSSFKIFIFVNLALNVLSSNVFQIVLNYLKK